MSWDWAFRNTPQIIPGVFFVEKPFEELFMSSETEVGPCFREGFKVSGLVFGRENNL